jgi:RHS repeat-associated protein
MRVRFEGLGFVLCLAAALWVVGGACNVQAKLAPHDSAAAQAGLAPPDLGLPVSDRVQSVHDRAGRLRFWMDANGASASPQRIGYRRYDGEGRVVEEGEVEGRFDAPLLRALAEHSGEPSGAQRQWRRRYVYGTAPRRGVPGPPVQVHTRDLGGEVHVQGLRYDGLGRLVGASESLGAGEPALHTRYRYDERGRLVRVDGPSASLDGGDIGLDYVYDEQGRLLSIGRHAHGVSEPAHYARYTWDARGRLLREERNPNSREGRLLLRYAHDGKGRLSAIDASVNGQPRYAQSLRYDGELIDDMRQTYIAGRGAAQRQHWRRGQQAAAAAELVDPRTERLLQAAGDDGALHAYAYDRNGNVLRKTGHLERIDIDPFLDRTQSLRTAQGTQQLLRYGGLQLERVWQSSESGPPGRRSTVQQAYYRGLSDYPLLIRRDEQPAAGEGAPRRRHQRMVWGPTGLVAVNDGDDGGTWGADRFVIGNHQSSTVMVLDGHGRTLASYAYSERGDITGADGLPLKQEPLVPYLFQGQEQDWASGLHNYRARLYDSATRRFLAPDPVVVAGQPAYLAMNGDAVNFIDPDGRMVAHSSDLNTHGVRWHVFGLTVSLAMTAAEWGLYAATELGAALWAAIPAVSVTGAVYVSYLAVNSYRDAEARHQFRSGEMAIVLIDQIDQGPDNGWTARWLNTSFAVAKGVAKIGGGKLAVAYGTPFRANHLFGPAAHYSTGQTAAIYSLAWLTNTLAMQPVNGAIILLEDAVHRRPHPEMSYAEEWGWSMVNDLIGNACFYTCMFFQDISLAHVNRDHRLKGCTRVWIGCRGASRFTFDVVTAEGNITQRISDAILPTFIGFGADYAFGTQITAKIVLVDVHEFLFPDPAALRAMLAARGGGW